MSDVNPIWQPIDTAPKDGTQVLAVDRGSEVPYITAWDNDVQGCAGWFSYRYRDVWHDYPEFDNPVRWCPVPKVTP